MALRLFGTAAGFGVTWLVPYYFGAGDEELGKKALGIFTLSFAVLNISVILARLGLDTAIVRFVAAHARKGEWGDVKELYLRSLYIILPLAIFLSAVLYAVAPSLAVHFFDKPHLAKYFRITCWFTVPLALLFFHAGALRGLKKISAFSFFQMAAISTFSVLLLPAAAFYSTDLAVPVYVQMIALCVASVLAILIWLRTSKLFQHKATRHHSSEKIIGTSVPMMIISSSTNLWNWVTFFILGKFMLESDVGVFSVVFKVSGILGIALMAVNSIAAPKFAEIHSEGDRNRLARNVHHSSELVFWVSAPLVLLLLLLPNTILSAWPGGFTEGTNALIILVVAKFINNACGPVGNILQMTGKQFVLQNIGLFALGLNIVLSLLLVKPFGLEGVAFSVGISMVMSNVLASIMVWKYYRIIPVAFIGRWYHNAGK